MKHPFLIKDGDKLAVDEHVGLGFDDPRGELPVERVRVGDERKAHHDDQGFRAALRFSNSSKKRAFELRHSSSRTRCAAGRNGGSSPR